MALPVGINAGHFFSGVPDGFADTIRRIEDLGSDGLCFAEAYGSDVFTPLADAAALTHRIRLGTAVAQIPARTPTATATSVATLLDHLSGGRVVLGLGASGPQVSEGWHGVAYPRPLARTREYVGIVRRVLAREKPLDHDGEFHQLPLRDGTGDPAGEFGPRASQSDPIAAAPPIPAAEITVNRTPLRRPEH